MNDDLASEPSMPSKGLESNARLPRFRRSRAVTLGLTLAATLAGGCKDEPPRPRELPFPTFEPGAPFPELVAPAVETRTASPGDFERLLQGDAREVDPAGDPALQDVPLGGVLVGRLPVDADAWRWSSAGNATLVLYAPGEGRPAALIYTESFGPLIRSRPSEEHHRFQVAVDPRWSEGYLEPEAAWDLANGGPRHRIAKQTGLARTEAGQLVQLLETRTGGLGLGFRPAARTFTGWRWVGRNPNGVTLRVGRQSGTWADPNPLPARFREAVERLGMIPGGEDSSMAPAVAALEVPAYLVLGSAAAAQEESGIHLAILCVRAPTCLVAQELASFLDSIQIGHPGLVERLLAQSPPMIQDLAQAAGLEILPVEAVPTPEQLAEAGAPSALSPTRRPPAGPAP